MKGIFIDLKTAKLLHQAKKQEAKNSFWKEKK